MGIPVQSGGIELDTRVLDELLRNNPLKLDGWLSKVADTMRDEIALSISGPSPSAPGDPPGMVSETLHDSILSERMGYLNYVISAGPDYAVFLEMGTEKMAARPFFTPVFEEWNQGKFAEDAKGAGLLRV